MLFKTEHKIIALLSAALIMLGGYVAFSQFRNSEGVEVPPGPESAVPAAPAPVPVASPVLENPTAIPEEKPAAKPTPKPTPPSIPEGTDQFIVSLADMSADIAQKLLDAAYIKDSVAFGIAIGTNPIAAGGYKISHAMTSAQILQVLRGKPYMKWVTIKPGLRKEEIANILATTLGWTAKQKTDWITKDTATKPDYIEGVYAPDTYLIPVAEPPADVAARLISKFNEGFASYLPQFTAKNIKWTTGLTLASIVQREAANGADMPLIAGILWNRLNQGIMLEVDATLQYARGDKGAGWWAPITLADKQTDSPYNTYKHTGLPPHPISNPAIIAVDAVLNPAATDCIYYLHDKNRVTHCAKTYEEHLKNIDLYLKS